MVAVSIEKNPQDAVEGGSENLDDEVETPENYLEDTLFEIHELISDLENPFTLVGKLISSLGKDKTLQIITGDKKEEPKKDSEKDASFSSAPGYPPVVPRRYDNNPARDDLKQDDTAKNQVERVQGPPIVEPNNNTAKQDTKNQPEDFSQSQDRQNKPWENMLPSEFPATRVGSPPSAETPFSPSTSMPEQIDLSRPEQEEAPLHFPPVFPLQRDGLSQSSAQPEYGVNLELVHQLNSIELASVLVNLFGKDGSIEVLGCYAKRKWIEEEVARLILDAITLLGKADGVKAKQGVKEASTEDHRIALYLLEQFRQSLRTPQLSAQFLEYVTTIKSIFDLPPKPTPAQTFGEQNDLR